jgi:hypothetical protein
MKSTFLWLLLLVLLVYIIINLKMYESYTGYDQTEFVDYPNNDIRLYTNTTDSNCKNKCNNTTGCVGYVTDFIPNWGPGKCWLKSKMDPTNARNHLERISNTRY